MSANIYDMLRPRNSRTKTVVAKSTENPMPSIRKGPRSVEYVYVLTETRLRHGRHAAKPTTSSTFSDGQLVSKRITTEKSASLQISKSYAK